MAFKHRFQYAVVEPTGELSKRYPLETKYDNAACLANCAAEDFHSRPEAAGLVWPLTFVAFTMAGQEVCRCEVKCWMVPHFLVTSGAHHNDRSRTQGGRGPHWSEKSDAKKHLTTLP